MLRLFRSDARFSNSEKRKPVVPYGRRKTISSTVDGLVQSLGGRRQFRLAIRIAQCDRQHLPVVESPALPAGYCQASLMNSGKTPILLMTAKLCARRPKNRLSSVIRTQKPLLRLSNVPRKRMPKTEGVSTADAFIAEKRIGQRIKRLRLKKSMGLVELGDHTGLSASYLSQLETGRVVPTIRNLARIAMVFSKDLSYFFDPEPMALFRVHRATERMRLPESGRPEPSYYFESLAFHVPDRCLDAYLAEFQPDRKPSEVRAHAHSGYEFVYILEGQLEIRHGEREERLNSGDSVYFDSGTAHTYRCTSKSWCKALIVTVNPVVLSSPVRHFGGPPQQFRQTQAAPMQRNNRKAVATVAQLKRE
jgi:transcriptional regulator with XRE-family HTH domain